MAKHNLLTLATEVRLSILKHYFDGVIGHCMSMRRYDPPIEYKQTYFRKVEFFRPEVIETVDLAVLRVCSILRTESIGIMAADVPLELDWTDETDVFSPPTANWFYAIAQRCICFVKDWDELVAGHTWEDRPPDVRSMTVHVMYIIDLAPILKNSNWTVDDTNRLQEQESRQRLHTHARRAYRDAKRVVGDVAHLQVQFSLGSCHVDTYGGDSLQVIPFVSPLLSSA